MGAPIQFRGKTYASIQEMPPALRIAYGEELFQAGADEVAAADEDIAKADAELAAAAAQADAGKKPAWGDAGRAGGIPVPVVFDSVTSLGPARAVHAPEDGFKLPRLGAPRPTALVIYRDGLAYQAGKNVHTLRWDEIAAIQSNVWYTNHAIYHEYSLRQSGGEDVVLDNGVSDIKGAIAPIKEAVFARLLPPLTRAYGAGQTLAFGPVSIHKPTGIQLDGKLLGWPAITDVKPEAGRIIITLRDGKKQEVRTSAIPNVELMAKLIGLDYAETFYVP